MSTAQGHTSKQSNGRSNRLIGWLVSYDINEKGAYYEIRAGRSFVTAQELPGERVIVLESKNISTPHIVFNSSSQHQIMIQDVFSSTGSFLRKAGSKDELKLEEPTALEHGDWIRIGEKTKFQVCLINGASN